MKPLLHHSANNVRNSERRIFCVLLLILTLFLMTMTLITAGQPIRNGGLERWQTGAIERPDSFFTSDLGTPAGSVTRTTNAHTGQYAALLKTTITSSLTTQVGGIWYGVLDTAFVGLKGWPVSGRPVRLTFWYKYSRQGNDSAVAVVVLTKWKNGGRAQVGQGGMVITSNATSYTQAIVPISSSELPDSIIVAFGSSNNVATEGSMLFIDDIALDNGTGIEGAPQTTSLRLYPNPSSGVLTLDMPEESGTDVTVADIAGNVFYHKQHSGQHIHLDCRTWPCGIYVVSVRCGEKVYQARFDRD